MRILLIADYFATRGRNIGAAIRAGLCPAQLENTDVDFRVWTLPEVPDGLYRIANDPELCSPEDYVALCQAAADRSAVWVSGKNSGALHYSAGQLRELTGLTEVPGLQIVSADHRVRRADDTAQPHREPVFSPAVRNRKIPIGVRFSGLADYLVACGAHSVSRSNYLLSDGDFSDWDLICLWVSEADHYSLADPLLERLTDIKENYAFPLLLLSETGHLGARELADNMVDGALVAPLPQLGERLRRTWVS